MNSEMEYSGVNFLMSGSDPMLGQQSPVYRVQNNPSRCVGTPYKHCWNCVLYALISVSDPDSFFTDPDPGFFPYPDPDPGNKKS